MIDYNRGDVVLIPFVFTDETDVKKRPALVISTDDYHLGRQEVIVSAITSNISRVLIGDCIISEWKKAGLLYPSVVTGIIRTVKQFMIVKKLGNLAEKDMREVEQILRKILDL